MVVAPVNSGIQNFPSRGVVLLELFVVLGVLIDLRERHRQELENLTLTTQPFKTLRLFILAIFQYFRKSVLYLLAKGGWLMLLSTLIAALGILLVTIEGPHEKVIKFVGYSSIFICFCHGDYAKFILLVS